MVDRRLKRIDLRLCILVFLFLISGCTKSTPPIPSGFVDLLLLSPEEIEIGGKEYLLESKLWLDLMPGTGVGNPPLIAVMQILTADASEIPSSLDADWLWVIRDKKEVWEARFSAESTPTNSHKLEKVARGESPWGPRTLVDVVVRLVDTQTGEMYLLKASNQLIGTVF
jgi:hypothetical protein